MADSALAQRIDEPKYRRVNPTQRALIRQLAANNTSQTEIARVLGVSQPTVSRWLAELVPLADTRDLAKQIAHTRAAEVTEAAFDAALKSARAGDAEASLELADRLEVLPKRQTESNRTGVQIVIGMPGSPGGLDPLESVNVIHNYQTRTEVVGQHPQALTSSPEPTTEAKVPGESL